MTNSNHLGSFKVLILILRLLEENLGVQLFITVEIMGDAWIFLQFHIALLRKCTVASFSALYSLFVWQDSLAMFVRAVFGASVPH